MNAITWTDCVKLAISELNNAGIYQFKGEKSIRLLNSIFRVCEYFAVPYSKPDREPKLFSSFLEARTQCILYCNNEVKQGSLSTEGFQSQLQNKIIPQVHDMFINETSMDVDVSYIEFLQSLELKTISYNTVHGWLKHLDFNYSIHEKTYCTDGHERENVVYDSENRFVDAYFYY